MNRILLAVLIISGYFVLFQDLGDFPLKQWDESRQAVNAYEMMERNSSIVSYFEGKPDHWSSKPTLVPFLQQVSMRLFGVNEWAFRFPVALFAAMTVLLVVWMGRLLFNNWTIGLLSGLILLTTKGFIHYHVSLTGDYDGVLLFFTTLASLAWYKAITANDPKLRQWTWGLFTIALAGGVLTKGVAALLFTPALVLFAMYRRQLVELMRSPTFWTSIFLVLVIIFSYYFGREALDPGFLEAVWQNELSGRFLETIESHKAPAYYFVKMVFDFKFVPWWYFLSLALFWIVKKTEFREPGIYLFLLATIQMLVVSVAATKLPYYEAPIYPWLAIATGAGIHKTGMSLLSRVRKLEQGRFRPVVLGLVFLAIWAPSLAEIFPHKKSEWAPTDDARVGKVLNEREDLDPVIICHYGYNAHNIFYEYKGKSQGRRITKDWVGNLAAGDTLALCEKNHWDSLNHLFTYQILHKEEGPCAVVRLSQRNE